ncbi:hypothetical protein CONLIGDRAFT_636468 [Coniochaeta ligniaria NRRL 30616]|uniref:Uncharacterized protein n=1 Tax=Coniochaeta ligniaria NRRL 30616 TaxID=1408157 RepID=A0A1J7ICI3_9PEZI|nr:hypothetical protein CONLIGDRAFT_636468 [Coniochaeta ligniaria NRRL 30616]
MHSVRSADSGAIVLTCSSLQFLDMLSAAQDRSSVEYEGIYDFLRQRQLRKTMALSLRSLRDPPPAKPSSAPNPNTIPLLTRVSAPGEVPRYKPTIRPRPLSELGGSGRRRVPVLEKANFLPFLRLTKPQPAIVSRVIRQKAIRMTKVVETLQAMVEETQEAAEWEDQWEKILETQQPIDTSRPPRRPGPFLAGVKQDIYNLRGRLLGLRLDDHARGEALQKLVMEEKALAEKEKVERQERRRKERQALKAARGAAPGSVQEFTDAIRGDVGDQKKR